MYTVSTCDTVETKGVSQDASSHTSNVLGETAVEIPNRFHAAAKRDDDAATERVFSVLPPVQLLDVEQPTELVAIPMSREAEASSEIGPPGSIVALTARKENENTPSMFAYRPCHHKGKGRPRGPNILAHVRQELQCAPAQWHRRTHALRRISADLAAPSADLESTVLA